MNDLQTETVFPVVYGTEVEVTCRGKLEVLGDSVITCVKHILYGYKSRRPKCVNSGELQQIERVLYIFMTNSSSIAETSLNLSIVHGVNIIQNYHRIANVF